MKTTTEVLNGSVKTILHTNVGPTYAVRESEKTARCVTTHKRAHECGHCTREAARLAFDAYEQAGREEMAESELAALEDA